MHLRKANMMMIISVTLATASESYSQARLPDPNCGCVSDRKYVITLCSTNMNEYLLEKIDCK